jgi:flagellar hook-basal body complex protein FliE
MAIIGPIPALGGVERIASAAELGSIGSASAADPLASGGLNSPGAPGITGAPGVSGSSAAGPGQGFLDTLGSAFGQLNQQLVSADASLADFAAGGSSDLHTVMLQMQEASLGLKLGIQVRDRFLEAYQEIMRLQL